MSFMNLKGWMSAAMLLSLGAGTSAFAQSQETPGVVRISDGRVKTPGGQVTQTAFGHMHGGSYAYGGVNGSCPTGNCPTGNCPTGNCPTGRCPHGHGGLFCDHYCHRSPDYGYSPPSKYPLYRRGVEYTNYYPNQWWGAGADYSRSTAPMVYQPTDTTQMGFYYQHVPYWQPMPGRLPERPIPAQWHVTPPAVQGSRFGHGGYASYGYGGHGWHGWHGRNVYNYNCPPSYGTYPADGTPAQPAQGNGPTEVVPPAQSAPAPVDSAPRPIEAGSPSALPGDGYDSASEPTALPDLNVVPGPNDVPARNNPPTSSAASNHIRRISYRTTTR